MASLPFEEEDRGNGWFLRKFSAQTDPQELTWHRDREDREIVVVSSDGWLFQSDNNLPVLLENGKTLKVKKGQWHRTIAGNNDLILLIHKESL